METILLSFSPFVVSFLVWAIKPVKNFASSPYRTTILRVVVALLSFGSVVGTSVLSGGEVDAASLQTFAESLLVFLGATGTHFFTRKNTE